MKRPFSSLRDSSRTAVRPQDFGWMVFGNLAFAGSQWVMLSILAHLGGSSVVGEFTLALAVVTPIMMFAQLRLRDVVATDMGGERPFTDYLMLTGLSSALAVVAAVLVGLLLEGPGPVLWVVLAWALARGSESLSLIVYGLQQQKHEMNRVGVSMITRGTLGALFVGTMYLITDHLAWSVGSVGIANVVVFLSYDIRGARGELRGFRWGPKGRRLLKLALSSVPLGAFALLTSLNDNIPRLMLNETHSKSILGIFGAFGFVVLGGSSITRALGQAAAPRLGRAFVEGNGKKFRKQLGGLVAIAGGLGLVSLLAAVTIGEWVLKVAFGSEFAAYSSDFVLVVVYAGFLFFASPLTVALIAARRYRAQLYVQICSVLAVATVGLLAIPGMGIRGAALALISAGMVRVFASAVLLRSVVLQLESSESVV